MADRIYRQLPLPAALPDGAVRHRRYLQVGHTLFWGQLLLTLERDTDVLTDTAQLFLTINDGHQVRRMPLRPLRLRPGVTVDALATAEIPGQHPHAVLLEFRAPQQAAAADALPRAAG